MSITSRKMLLIFICLLFSVHFATAAGDEIWINQQLESNKGSTFTLPAGTYTISDTIIVPEDTIFQGTVSANGELQSIITLVSDASLDAYQPLINAASNTKILYLILDGNSMNQGKVPTNYQGKNWGQGYDNFIKFEYCTGIEVAYCEFRNSLGDGLRAINSNDIKFHDNKCWKLGHDAVFIIRSEGAWVYNNYIQPRSNSAVRLMDASHVRVDNNTINYIKYYDGISYNAGPSLQIQHDTGIMIDIEVCNNIIYNSCGPALWLVDKTGTSEQLDFHHNLLMNSGNDHGIYWVGGVIANGYDAIFANNCFNGSYLAGISYYDVSGGWSHTAQDEISANIFTNAILGTNSNTGGWGINNELSEQSIITSENCFYNNAAGDVRGTSTSSSDVFVDPKINPTPSGWRWVNDHWECDYVKPKDLDDYVIGSNGNNSYSGLKPISEKEMDDIFDILDTKFVYSGITNQTAESVHFTVQKTPIGKIFGGIQIVGFPNQTAIDNKSFIPDNKSILIKYAATRDPSLDWFNLNVDNISTNVSTTIENGTAYAKLDVKMKYFRLSHNNTTGTTKKKYHTAHATFNDSKKSPDILQRPKNLTGIIYAYPTHTLIRVQCSNISTHDNLTKITYEYNEKTIDHIFMVGEQKTDQYGIKRTNFTRVNYWDGVLSIYGDYLYIEGAFDPNNLTVTAYTPYESFPVEHFDYYKKTPDEDIVTWWFYPSIGSLCIIFYGIYHYLKIIFN